MKNFSTFLSLLLSLGFAPITALSKESGEKETKHKVHAKHKHKHKKDCGHKATVHGDHTDYDHDGHAHKAHAGHVDECEGGDSASKPEDSEA